MSKKAKSEKRSEERRMGAGREIIESIVIAFVLAFLFRTFEAEAFVIPTGSMASTLMGVHKDVTCEACGYQYQVGASQEEDGAEYMAAVGATMSPQQRSQFWNRVLVRSGLCPNCRFPMDLREPVEEPTYQGDRILVSKFAYQFADPERWDVIVFRYPNQSWTNYIKRLIGLPGETLDIRNGDIFVKPPGGEEFTIARKPADKLMAMARIVHDTDFVPLCKHGETIQDPGKSIYDAGWPAPWQAAPDWLALANSEATNLLANWDRSVDPAGKFTAAEDYKSYSTDGSSQGMAWLRFRQMPPSQSDWDAMISTGKVPPTAQPMTIPIQDFLAYNEGEPNAYIDVESGAVGNGGGGLHNWVGDLILEATLDVQGSEGSIVLETVEAGYFFRCTIDIATGEAELTIEASNLTQQPGPRSFDAAGDAEPSVVAKAQTPIKGAGQYHVRFANVDNELRFWASPASSWGEPEQIVFDTPTTYAPLGISYDAPAYDTEADKSAVGIGAQGVALTASQLRLWRDIYYTEPDQRVQSGLHVHGVEVPEGMLFAMGDNSDRSKDSRYFGFVNVERELIGKALYVYWPHAWNVVWPNFDRMNFVR